MTSVHIDEQVLDAEVRGQVVAVPFRRHEQVDDGRLPQMRREHIDMGAPYRFVVKVEGGFVEPGSPDDSMGV